MPASTVHAIVERHRGNSMLSARYLSPAASGPRDLSTDQPIVPIDPAVAAAVTQALLGGQTHYVDVPGIGPLREALVAHLEGLGAKGYAVASTAVTAGIQEGRFLSLQVVGEGFDDVAIPAVVHPGARQAIGLRAKTVHTIPVDTAAGMLPTLDGLRQVLDAGCKLVYLESPVRFTGATFDSAAVQQIADMLTAADAYAIWDQGLSPWAGDNYVSLGASAGMAERATLIGEAFPGSGLESLGIGYLATSEARFAGVAKIKQVMAICTSTPSQFAALAASERFGARRSDLRASLASARSSAVRAAGDASLQVVDGDTVHILALGTGDTAAASTLARALADGGFGFAAGDAFGAPGFVRLTASSADSLAAALDTLR